MAHQKPTIWLTSDMSKTPGGNLNTIYEHSTSHWSVKPGRPSRYGRKYEICAPLRGPNGQQRWLRTVWMIRHGETSARLITLIPEKHP